MTVGFIYVNYRAVLTEAADRPSGRRAVQSLTPPAPLTQEGAMHPERLTAGRCGVTCDPNRTFGPRPIECDFITPEPTGDATLDGVRNMAALANHFGELCIGAKWHDLAGRIAAGHAGAREEAEAKLAVLRGLSDEPSDDLKERMRMEHGPARSRGAA